MTLQPNGDPSAISGSLAFSSYKPSFEEAGETREVSGLPVASVATAPPPGGLYSTLVLWDHGSILRGKKKTLLVRKHYSFCFFEMGEGVSCTSHQPQAHCVAEDDLELLVLHLPDAWIVGVRPRACFLCWLGLNLIDRHPIK